ncbi:MAG: Ig-like domain-containing protein, partial [Candidatus Marinimicrobia bacterium]|nr:Ig-like domain-containing protein [Candidatus Neomarinimicrobiota bacterium]
NALTWVSGQTQTDWLSYSPEAGVIPPGSSQDIEVQFSAVDIEGGTYSTNIQILSNDEDQPELLIPVELIANIPYPNIVLETDQMDVNLFLGDSATRSIVIGNDGVADLNWSVDILEYGRDGTFYSFNNCGGEAHEGPSQEDCDGEYDSTTLQGSVTVNEGIQQWTVPQSGEYTIEVFGAQGGGETNAGLAGGLGARMGGTFYLEEGEILQVLIGQMGVTEGYYGGGYAGGGGGGSFVTRGTHDSDESILIVAGGGGGSGTSYQGYDAIIETYGSTSTGSAGQGGVPGSNGNSGAGFFGNGLFGGHNGATISYSYVNGGMGGIGYSGGGTGYGGFGGGAGDGYADGGGGGGYSGGNGWENLAGGYGGASYNSGDEQENEAGVNSGHGQVVITLDSPTITWISTSQDSGVVSVGETDTLHVHFNASELEEGEYFADLNLLSDDPDDPDISLPTSLTVFEQVMLADMPDTSVHEDGMLELTIDVDYPGYEHELTVTSDTSGIEVSVIGDTIGLMPITDWTGVASMEVILTIENSLSDTVEFQLDVTAVNDPPNAIDHWYYINEDSSLVAYLPANDGDSLNGEHDDQSLTFTSMSSFEHGSFDLGREDGLLTYEPYMNYFGPDSMEYILMDDGTTNGQYDALMDTGLIVINIMPVNDDPVLADLVDTTMHEDSTLMITISASDVDNDTLTFDVSFSIDEYVAEISIPADSKLIGLSIHEANK